LATSGTIQRLDLAAASETAVIHWFTREELPGLSLAEDTLKVIRKGFTKQGGS
jgi:hypothetical protein